MTTPPEQSRYAQRTGGFARSFYQHGETFYVEDPDGNTWTFSEAIVGNERTEQRPTEFGTEVVVTRDVAIPIDAAGRHEDGRPDILNLRGFAVAGGIRYAIEGIETSRTGFATLKTKRVDLAEMSRENYRRQV